MQIFAGNKRQRQRVALKRRPQEALDHIVCGPISEVVGRFAAERSPEELRAVTASARDVGATAARAPVAEAGVDEQGGEEDRNVFPSAMWIAETPTVRPMHGERAEQHRQQRDGGHARVAARHQCRASKPPQHDGVYRPGRKAVDDETPTPCRLHTSATDQPVEWPGRPRERRTFLHPNFTTTSPTTAPTTARRECPRKTRPRSATCAAISATATRIAIQI